MVVFEGNAAESKLRRYQGIRKYLLTNSHATPTELYNELARQAGLTEVGRAGGGWWSSSCAHLRW